MAFDQRVYYIEKEKNYYMDKKTHSMRENLSLSYWNWDKYYYSEHMDMLL